MRFPTFLTPSLPLMRCYLISGKCREFWTTPKYELDYITFDYFVAHRSLPSRVHYFPRSRMGSKSRSRNIHATFSGTNQIFV